MTTRNRVRLPLQTGGGSFAALLWMAATWTATFVGASFVVLLAVLPSRDGPVWVAIAIPGICSLGFGSVSIALFREYRKQRASDVEIDERELRFVHGAAGGSAIPWSEIESCTITTDTTRYVSTTSGGRTTTEYNDQLWLERRGSERQLLAESVDHDEKASLAELREVILGACEARGGAVTARDRDDATTTASVIRCAACGAPVAPAGDESTKCGICGATVTLAEDVREKIRSAASLGSANERLEAAVEKLLDQPPAPAANRPLDLLGFLILGVPALAIVLYFVPQPAGGVAHAVSLLLVGVPLMIAIAFLTRLFIAERQALRSLTTGMSARNPLRAGEPPRCRQCGGTLLIRPGHVVAICVFCRSENLLGLDLRPALAAAQSQTYELGTILAKREIRRRVAKTGFIVFAIVAVTAFISALF